MWRGGSSISRHFNTLVLCCVEGRGIKYHEMFRDLLAVVSMHILEPQSRTFPLYMTVWQLHSILYLEKSRDIWDSVLATANFHAIYKDNSQPDAYFLHIGSSNQSLALTQDKSNPISYELTAAIHMLTSLLYRQQTIP